jgi:hypothetical protein
MWRQASGRKRVSGSMSMASWHENEMARHEISREITPPLASFAFSSAHNSGASLLFSPKVETRRFQRREK